MRSHSPMFKECVICLDSTFAYNQQLLLQKLNYYGTCACNCLIHSKCLHKWVVENNNCPICHKQIITSTAELRINMSTKCKNMFAKAMKPTVALLRGVAIIVGILNAMLLLFFILNLLTI